MNEIIDYRKLLKSELDKRSGQNPKYSLRAFAKALKIDPGDLSKVLSKKANMSVNSAIKIVNFIDWNSAVSEAFVQSVANEKNSKQNTKLKRSEIDNFSFVIDEDVFNIISDWYHYGILELSESPEFKLDASWIAKKLGISRLQAKLGTERLMEQKLLIKKGCRYRKAQQHTLMKNSEVTRAKKRHARQVLEMAKIALDNVPVDDRKFTSVTVASDPERIEKAKKMIDIFKRKLRDYLEAGERNEVFHLFLGLYPVKEVNLNLNSDKNSGSNL